MSSWRTASDEEYSLEEGGPYSERKELPPVRSDLEKVNDMIRLHARYTSKSIDVILDSVQKLGGEQPKEKEPT